MEAEYPDVVDIPLEPDECVEKKGEDSSIIEGPSHGRGRRKKVANKLYQQFWRHDNEDNPNDDTLLP